jgi:mannose/fructose/N-acetylgalactosamine-specific phosphotransferase system component IIC
MAITAIVTSPITLITLAIVAAVALLAAGIVLLVKHWDSVVAVLKVVGGFFVDVGQAMMKWMLTPINLVMDAIGGLLTLLSKIPGVGDKIRPAVDALNSFQGKMNTTLTGSAGAYDYAAPFTKTSETRSVQESRQKTINEVYVRPDNGASISGTRGGAPAQVLMYGAAQ